MHLLKDNPLVFQETECSAERSTTIAPPSAAGAALVLSLARAAAVARLDQTLANHPLRPAFLYRARLEAVRRQAAHDGQAIDPWHLAALLEGLHLRMEGALRIIDRGAIFEAARHALTLHQWLVSPDFDQEGEVQRAERALAAAGSGLPPLLAAGIGLHQWLDEGGERAPIRAAAVRYWGRRGVLRTPIPLTGAAALRADTPWGIEAWLPLFLDAVAIEAEDGQQLLFELERAWLTARRQVAGRRSTSRAAAAIDVLAAAPLLSATSLAAGLGMAVKNAAALLAEFCAAGIAIEVTHRSKRRLFGLAALAPLRHEVAPPRRPEPGRGRGRPPLISLGELVAPAAPLAPLQPVIAPLERLAFDYSDLDQWMQNADDAIRQTRRVLERIKNR